jgi:methionyl-tRNA formyltransferase
MKKLKIGYFADGPWSHNTLDLLLDDASIEISFIVPRIDTKDETLLNKSKKHGIDYIKPARINSFEFIDLAKSYDCDLFVSMSFNQIFKAEVLNIPPLGTINCHAGLLPFYRGRNVLNWVLINDEKDFGITVHYIDEGIDTGDIILQERFIITDNDNYNTLLNLAYKECPQILVSAIKLIQQGNATRIPQSTIHPVGLYCGRRIAGDEILNWNQKSRAVFNFVRSITSPGPNARSFINGTEVLIEKVNLVDKAAEYIGIPGQVLVVSENRILVKTLDSTIEIIKYSSNVNIKPGQRLRNE